MQHEEAMRMSTQGRYKAAFVGGGSSGRLDWEEERDNWGLLDPNPGMFETTDFNQSFEHSKLDRSPRSEKHSEFIEDYPSWISTDPGVHVFQDDLAATYEHGHHDTQSDFAKEGSYTMKDGEKPVHHDETGKPKLPQDKIIIKSSRPRARKSRE